MEYEIPKQYIEHLAGQFERARPVLFTGAGFSLGAKNVARGPIPSAEELKKYLWAICFPDQPYDVATSLPALFDNALLRHRPRLEVTLKECLTVASESLQDWYGEIFRYPWYRAYTLNIDDLDMATGRRFELPRPVRSSSALHPIEQAEFNPDYFRVLHVVHLNGVLADAPENITFSTIQYAERLVAHDPWYLRLSAELSTLPFVFVGTALDEPSLWQYIELRQERGERGVKELRPRSYLITPSLDLAKQALLAEYNVQWLPLRAEEFVRRFLGQLTASRDRGLTFLASKADRKRPASQELPEVATLAAVPLSQTEYLLGHEPIWADIQTGRAIERVCDVSLLETTKRILSTVGKPKGILIVTGTAGSGKTTALMRLCLDLVREGYAVGWNDRDSELSPRNIRGAMIANEAPRVLAIDDADLFGSELAPMLRDIALADTFPLCIVGIRAGRLERALNPVLLKAIPVREETMPHLEDRDIRRLIGVLDRENRLGILKGKSSDEQYRLLSQQAGRQLLVAMIQATSGEKFEDKVVNELDELETEAQLIYAIIAVASSFRYALAREEIVLACKKHPSNIVLNLLEQLSRRHLVSSADGLYRARHRVIADLLVSELTKLGRLAEVIYGLALVAATKCGPGSARSTKAARFLRMLINHDFLSRTVGIEPARNFYGKLEDILSWDSHYWLQRGSLEVESGSISLAENFLNQAKGLAPDDVLVQNEFAYLQFRKAIENPLRVDAKDLVEQAVRTLETLIALRGNFDSYPFHVLGSQGLSWSRRGIVDKQQRISFLQQLLRTVENGCGRHPYQKDLSELRDDLKRELLGQAVR